MMQPRSVIPRPGKPKLLAIAYGLLLFAYLFIVPSLTGCSRGPENAIVTGVVTLDGEPVSDVEVVFLPDLDSGIVAPRSACYTDKLGRYTLRTDKGVEGAAVGTHRVLINDTAFLPLPPLPPGLGPISQPPRPDRPPVPDKYGDLLRTPIKSVEVKPGSQTHDFDLVSGK